MTKKTGNTSAENLYGRADFPLSSLPWLLWLLHDNLTKRYAEEKPKRFKSNNSELGLAHQKANVWLSKEHLTVEYGDEPLSQYAVQYQPDDKHLRDIREPRHFATRYRTPQFDLWQTDAVEWHLVKRMPLDANAKLEAMWSSTLSPKWMLTIRPSHAARFHRSAPRS